MVVGPIFEAPLVRPALKRARACVCVCAFVVSEAHDRSSWELLVTGQGRALPAVISLDRLTRGYVFVFPV